MTIQVSCPACSKSYQVKDAAAGKKFQCKGCETVVVVPDAESTSGDSSRSRSTTGESPKRKSASSSATSGGKRKSSTRPRRHPIQESGPPRPRRNAGRRSKTRRRHADAAKVQNPPQPAAHTTSMKNTNMTTQGRPNTKSTTTAIRIMKTTVITARTIMKIRTRHHPAPHLNKAASRNPNPAARRKRRAAHPVVDSPSALT